jgi:hypothetical protein
MTILENSTFDINYEKLKDIILNTSLYSDYKKENLDTLSHLSFVENSEYIDDTNIHTLVFNEDLCFKIYCDDSEILKKVDIIFNSKSGDYEIMTEYFIYMTELLFFYIHEENEENQFMKILQILMQRVEIFDEEKKEIVGYMNNISEFEISNNIKIVFLLYNDKNDEKENISISLEIIE